MPSCSHNKSKCEISSIETEKKERAHKLRERENIVNVNILTKKQRKKNDSNLKVG